MNKNESFIELITQKKLDGFVEQNIGFSSNIFMVFGLPTCKVKDNPFVWEKKTSLCNLTIQRHPKYEIPYGCYARMNQIFIDTEVKTKSTNVIDVGQSFSEYMKKLNYNRGKANKTLLKQLLNYITSVIRVEPVNTSKSHFVGLQTLVAKAWDIYFSVENPDQLMLSKGKIVLDEAYAKYIYKHSVPLDLDLVHCLKRNPLALDFYRFLAYRNNNLNRTISFPDHLLFEQLGTEQQNDRVVRARLKDILHAIQHYWPVQAKFEDGFFSKLYFFAHT
jgi:hypothetical protein